MIEVHFRQADCGPCAVRHQCTRADRRSLKLRPQGQHEAIRAARARQSTEAFKTEYALRAGIEGTIAQAVRRSGLRHARYRGRAKTRLQAVCTAVALNLARLAAWLGGHQPRTTRTAAYAALMVQAALP